LICKENSPGRADKPFVGKFTERAWQILEAAEAASARGEICTEMTILITQDGGIHMLADSSWPLESLADHHGARAAYRVREQHGALRVDAREGTRTCRMESISPAETARRMLR
jgi:hypothetical protein